MPLYNWFKIQDTNNLTYLRKEPKNEVEFTPTLKYYLTKLQDEYYERFGLGEEFVKLLNLKRQYIITLCDYIILDNKFKLTEAELILSDINFLMNEKKPISNEETVIRIEEMLGFKINTKEITVLEYYSYIQYLRK